MKKNTSIDEDEDLNAFKRKTHHWNQEEIDLVASNVVDWFHEAKISFGGSSSTSLL